MKSAFQRFNRKVTIESVLKSLGLASIIGFTVIFVIALICWLTGFKYVVVLSLSIGIAAIAAFTPLFYFRKFRPTAKKIAAKVDALGLEERLITMTELENDDSYIAMRQRQDALEKLAYVNEKCVKMRFSKRSIVAFAAAAAFGISVLTVSGLSASGLLPGFSDILDPANAETLYAVDYEVEGEGIIEGDANQLVLAGDSTEIVIAVPDDGWIFVGWDDGYEDPVRRDDDIQEDLLFIAIFEKLGYGNNGDGDPNGQPSEDGESSEGDDGDQDSEGSDGDQSDDSQDKDSSQPEDSDSPQKPDDNDEDNDSDSTPSDPNDENPDKASGQFVDNNKIIDDNIFYGDVLDQYRDLAMWLLENDDTLTEEDKEMIRNYFGII